MIKRGIKINWVKNFKTTGYDPSFSRYTKPDSLKSKKILVLPKMDREANVSRYISPLKSKLNNSWTAKIASCTPLVNTPVNTAVRNKLMNKFLLYCQKLVSSFSFFVNPIYKRLKNDRNTNKN